MYINNVYLYLIKCKMNINKYYIFIDYNNLTNIKK